MVLGMFTLVLAAVATPIAQPLGFPSVREATDMGPWHRPDALVVRLSPAAAQSLHARTAQATSSRLGVPDVDRVAVRFGGVRFEPVFVDESPTPPGSSAPDLTAYWILHLRAGSDLESALAAFSALASVEHVHPIATTPAAAVPNDSLWSAAHYFHQASRRDVHAVEAWDITTGDSGVVIAIIDTGILLDHPDLERQIWSNRAEREGRPGIDDDGNGFVDDIHGWDFVGLSHASFARDGEDWRDADNDPNDWAGHGTAVAGVAGAETNNGIGVVGTAWSVRLMPLRAAWSSTRAPGGEFDMTYVAQAIRYATRMGANVINCSFATVLQADLRVAVEAAIRAGVVIVAAAGNNGSPHGLGDWQEVISVAATDANDQVTLFSNRGPYVDLAAPGLSLATTSIARFGADSLASRQPTYTTGASGTSFSAPLVAGGVALLRAYRLQGGEPAPRPIEVLLRMIETADDISAMNPEVTEYGSGRLNLSRLLTDPPGTLVVRGGDDGPAGPGVMVRSLAGATRTLEVTDAGNLLVIDLDNGRLVRSIALSAPPEGGLAAADLGAGYGVGVFVATRDGLVHGLEANGAPRAGWPQSAGVSQRRTPREPALGDIDGDGTLEIVWGGAGKIWAWRVDGNVVPNYPVTVGGETAHVALSNLDAHPGVEIIVVTDHGQFFALNRNGYQVAGWTHQITLAAHPPVVTERSLGVPMVIVAGRDVISGFAGGFGSWGIALQGPAAGAPVLADLDGGGRDEIVFSQGVSSPLQVMDLQGNNRNYGAWPLLRSQPIGSPIVAAVGGGGLPDVLQYVEDVGLIAWDLAGQTILGFPKAGLAGRFASIVDFDADGNSDVLAGLGVDSSVFVYRTLKGSWNASAAHWSTPRGNFARTGSRLYAPPMAPFDDVPPSAVGDLAVTRIGTHAIELDWTAPTDPGDRAGAHAYDLRYADEPIDEATFGSARQVSGPPPPLEPGAAQRHQVTGLDEGQRYFFAMRCLDRVGNSSPISNVVEATTVRELPGTVPDLRVVGVTRSSVTVSWTATGDDGDSGLPKVYRVHAAEQPMDEPTFEHANVQSEIVATQKPGTPETATLENLDTWKRYWIAFRAVDHAGNPSVLSNVVDAFVSPFGLGRELALVPDSQPARAPIGIFWRDPSVTSSSARSLRIFDVAGRLRRSLALEAGSEGRVVWDGVDLDGRDVAPGVYLLALVGGSQPLHARIVLIR